MNQIKKIEIAQHEEKNHVLHDKKQRKSMRCYKFYVTGRNNTLLISYYKSF